MPVIVPPLAMMMLPGSERTSPAPSTASVPPLTFHVALAPSPIALNVVLVTSSLAPAPTSTVAALAPAP